MKKPIPHFIAPYLWSYNIDTLDVETNKEIIITQVLNLGTKHATDWLFQTYSKETICTYLKNPRPGMWNNKSLNYWGVMLGVEPLITKRF